MIALGSTISMEAWNNEIKPNQDWNHAWGAAPCNIIPRCVVGIKPIEIGFKNFVLNPHVCDTKEFNAIFPIPNNQSIKIEYSNGKMNIAIPENVSAIYQNQELNSGKHVIKL